MSKQEPPFAIQIEMTEGCNLFCKFCGIRGIREKPGRYKFMTIETAIKIAENIWYSGWNSRIEFAMHGEPTMNPYFNEIIEAFYFILPNNQLMMLTNGVGLFKNPKKSVKRLFDSGLNVLGIDDYSHNPFAKKIKAKVDGETYPGNSDGPHKRYKFDTQKLIYIQDIKEAKTGGHSTLNNHCGCASPPLRAPIPQRCAKPFRELSIRYNGDVAICCNDWRGHYYCGNAANTYLPRLWNNKPFRIARRMLYNKDRNFIPCKWCDARSYRVGFLPDKMGKQNMKPPTKKMIDWVNNFSTKKKTLTSAIKRKWEK